MPAGWKDKIATIEMNSVRASINEDRKTWDNNIEDDDNVGGEVDYDDYDHDDCDDGVDEQWNGEQ